MSDQEMPDPNQIMVQPPVQPQAQPQVLTPTQAPIEPTPESAPEPEKPKGFTRADVKRSIPVELSFPKIYPGLVFKFKLKFKLSAKAEEDRQEWLSLSPAETTEKTTDAVLAQLADLIVDQPEGFDDLKYDGKSWGSSFKSYVETSDLDAKSFLNLVAEGAYNLYWQTVTPREFRSAI